MKSNSIEEYLKVSESKAVEVLLFLLKNRDRFDKVQTTMDIIAEDCNVTHATVNRVFQKLYKKEFLTKLRNGHYQLHKL